MPKYSAREAMAGGIPVVQLTDSERAMVVSIAPSIGNMAYEMTLAGNHFLWFPLGGPGELRRKPELCGIPFLAPWANRLEDDAYWVNGKQHRLNPGLGNVRRDGNGKPIHGLLSFSPDWRLTGAGADAHSAWAVSRLDFGAHRALMAQFPFAHTITVSHRLAGGELAVETALENRANEPMPVAIGYHPYFQIPGVPRNQWRIHLAAGRHLVLNEWMLPTGETRPLGLADPQPLAAGSLDDGFTGLVRDPDGFARFWVEGGGRRIIVSYGPKYPVAVVYSPENSGFVCFEPMAAPTNAFGLAHAGLYGGLQCIPPGGVWRETWSVRPSLGE